MATRTVLLISDRTGLCASSMANSLLAQFQRVDYHIHTFSFIDNAEKMQQLCQKIASLQTQTKEPLIAFSTLVNPQYQQQLAETGVVLIDLFSTFTHPLEQTLQQHSVHRAGLSSAKPHQTPYQKRLDAIDFSLAHDDGVRPDQYDQADVILVGVSRCGKTPTSLYLAMNFSLKAVNYPLVDEELEAEQLPQYLLNYRQKLIALTIQAEVLQAIRTKRYAVGRYANLAACQKEVRAAEQLFRATRLPVFNMTNTSIEETAGHIMKYLQSA
jgi:regulator of PEP synthase PpsR (kinase-PPPase family)